MVIPVCQAHQRRKLEHLGRYIARPPVANQRLSVNGAGQIVYSLKQPFRDGTTHACIEDPKVIETTLTHIAARDAAEPGQPRAPAQLPLPLTARL